MEYNEILKKVEDQKNERELSGKMFRYSGLILAVDYFSQKLNSDQIMNAAFDFVNELLTLENSSLYSLQEGSFQLQRKKGNSVGLKSIPSTKKLNDLAVLHGNILAEKSAILRFFDENIYEDCNIAIVVPIIVEAELDGFIFVPEMPSGEFDENDRIICEVLMNLCNSAMRNYASYNELKNTNISLDEKIFNLFAINQSSKALLSQLDLDSLYCLSIDVFSELTQSSSTGFVLYDEKSEKYILRSYRYIFENIKSLNITLDINESGVVDPNRIIINMSNTDDVQYFNSIFKDGIRNISPLKARYIILLNKGSHVLGFVTLGETVTGTDYKKNIFELIESLASSTYTAISNAKHFKQVEEQKKIIQNKLDRLISLNTLVKNINSSINIETLIDITIKTLSIAFLADKCLIATYDKENKLFEVKSSHGINPGIVSIKPNTDWNRVLKGGIALAMENNELEKYFGNAVKDKFGDITGALIVPIYLNRADIELMGVIIVFGFFDSLISDEENVLTIETISGHIAPILYNLNVIEEQKTILMPNYEEIFKRQLKLEIEQAKEFDLELFVVKVSRTGNFSFKKQGLVELLDKSVKKLYNISGDTAYIITNSRQESSKESILKSADIQDISVDVYALGQDFNSLEEFLDT